MVSRTTLTDGSPVTDDHRELNPVTGQQKGYVVLSAGRICLLQTHPAKGAEMRQFAPNRTGAPR